jgi:hypothetical protein
VRRPVQLAMHSPSQRARRRVAYSVRSRMRWAPGSSARAADEQKMAAAVNRPHRERR